MEAINIRFVKIMEALGLSSYKLAKELNTSEAVLSNIKNGKNKPSIDIIERLLNLYEVINPVYILTGNGEILNTQLDTPDNTPVIPNVHYNNGYNSKTTENSAIPKVHYNGVHEPQPNYTSAAITISSILEQIKILCNCSTDNELAEFFGVKQVTISAWRVRNTINYELLINICAKYGWSLDILFGLKPSPVQSNQTNKDLIIAKLTGQVELLKELLAKK